MIYGLLLLSAALAAPEPMPPPAWQVDAGPVVASAVLSRGRSAVGGMIAGTFAPIDGPLLVGLRAHWTATDVSDGRIRLQHQRLGLEVLVGSFVQLGIGKIWGHAYGGPRWIHEHGAPIQAKRLQAAGLSQGADSDLVFPALGAEVGMGLSLLAGFGLAVAVGPELLLLPTSDHSSLEGHAGWMARGAVTYVF